LANHIYIFCRSTDVITLKELGHYVATIGLLDERPRFDPPLDSPAADDPEWTFLKVVYKADKRPIQIDRRFKPERMAPAIEDALSELADNDCSDEHPELVERIHSCRQIFHFELGLELTDDCWEMLDATESHIATILDGVVFASDGFYDNDLEAICTWK
jgi:hypothetical protein